MSSRHSPENAEAKQTRSRLTDGVFTCYLPQLVFFAFPAGREGGRDGGSRYSAPQDSTKPRACVLGVQPASLETASPAWAALARCSRKMKQGEVILLSVGRCLIFHLSVDCSLTCDPPPPTCFVFDDLQSHKVTQEMCRKATEKFSSHSGGFSLKQSGIKSCLVMNTILFW